MWAMPQAIRRGDPCTFRMCARSVLVCVVCSHLPSQCSAKAGEWGRWEWEWGERASSMSIIDEHLTAGATCLSTSCALHGLSWRALSIPGAPGICPAPSPPPPPLPPCSSHCHVWLGVLTPCLNPAFSFWSWNVWYSDPKLCLIAPHGRNFSPQL